MVEVLGQTDPKLGMLFRVTRMMMARAVRALPKSYRPCTGSTIMKFLRIRQVMQLTGLSRMTLYRLELAGEFPKRRQLSHNSVAWREEDVSHWIDTRPVAHLRRSTGRGSPPRRDL
jgi:predicted DNA-binding transcriptional regulator AlpA